VTGWADPAMTYYPATARLAVTDMPARPVEATAGKPRGHPDCGYCLWSPVGACTRHGYDPLASLGIDRQAPEERWMRDD
jgi:hypothetical protein